MPVQTGVQLWLAQARKVVNAASAEFVHNYKAYGYSMTMFSRELGYAIEVVDTAESVAETWQGIIDYEPYDYDPVDDGRFRKAAIITFRVGYGDDGALRSALDLMKKLGSWNQRKSRLAVDPRLGWKLRAHEDTMIFRQYLKLLRNQAHEKNLGFDPKTGKFFETVKAVPAQTPSMSAQSKLKVVPELVEFMASVPETTDKRLHVYVDGSCLVNPGGAVGWAAVFVNPGTNKSLYEVVGGGASGTNNTAELMAAITALENLPEGVSARIISDSSYVVNGMTSWMVKWERKDFKGVKNVELWRRLRELSRFRDVVFQWVRGHNGTEFNEVADVLAGSAAEAWAMKATA